MWSEFHTSRAVRNPSQEKIDLSKPKQLWFYLGKTSTEAKAHYTGDLSKPINDPAANFLDSVRPPPLPFVPPVQRRSYPASYPAGINIHAANAAGLKSSQIRQKASLKPPTTKERPYNGKYAITDPSPYPKSGYNYTPLSPRPYQNSSTQQRPNYNSAQIYRAPQSPMSSVAPMSSLNSSITKASSHQFGNGLDYRMVRKKPNHIP